MAARVQRFFGRLLARAAIAIVLLAVAGFVAYKASPWPSALALRWMFDRGGVAANSALAPIVPAGVVTRPAIRYDQTDPDAWLDIHVPANSPGGRRTTTIVWIHGGAFVSGSRTQVANYARLLAGDGYAVVAVDYSLAPAAKYPTPVLQVNQALAFLSANADRLGLGRNRIVLAGDSAGAQLAAQVAAAIASPAYARAIGLQPALRREQLAGTILFCGPLDGATMAHASDSSWFVRTVLWSYFGSPSPPAKVLDGFSVVRHVGASFPPTFISVGNADPLASQSYQMSIVLQRQGVPVDSLFFESDHEPRLQHEYQFDLAQKDAQEALRRVKLFLQRLETRSSADPRAGNR